MNAETIEQVKAMIGTHADIMAKRPALSMYLDHEEYERAMKDWHHAIDYSVHKLVSHVPSLLAAAEERDAARAEAERLRGAIESEPALPDDMPEDMFAAFRTMDREEMEEALRMLVRLTKKCILERAARPDQEKKQ